jgi:hypothetical protein
VGPPWPLPGFLLWPAGAAAGALYCGGTQVLPAPARTKWRISDAVIADLERRAAAGDLDAKATLDAYEESR